jgi:hypothetical protein
VRLKAIWLDSGRGVHDVAGGRPLTLARTRVEHHERLARIDADPKMEVEPLVLGVQLRKRPQHGQARPDGPFGVVLVRPRRAEQGEDRVAAELLEGAAVPLELGANPSVVGRNEGLHVLDVEALGASGRADQVAEDGRDQLPLLGGNDRLDRGEWRPALEAELCDLRIVLPALGANRHEERLRRPVPVF